MAIKSTIVAPDQDIFQQLNGNTEQEQEQKIELTNTFTVNNTLFQTSSLSELITNLETGEIFSFAAFLKFIAPNIYRSYTFNPNFPNDFYRIGASSRTKVLRRLQYLHKPPPRDELAFELEKIIGWISDNVEDKWAVAQGWKNALWATEYDGPSAASLILHYGYSPQDAKGKATKEFNFHSIEEDDTHIIIKTHHSSLTERFHHVKTIARNELDVISRGAPEKPIAFLKKTAFQKFYSAKDNRGLYLSSGPYFEVIQKTVQVLLDNPRAEIPDIKLDDYYFTELFEVKIQKQSLEKRKYYKPSKCEDAELEPERIYSLAELKAEHGIERDKAARAAKKGFLIALGAGKYKLNTEFKGGATNV